MAQFTAIIKLKNKYKTAKCISNAYMVGDNILRVKVNGVVTFKKLRMFATFILKNDSAIKFVDFCGLVYSRRTLGLE